MSLRSIIFTRENDDGAAKGTNITPANGKYENEANTNSKGCVVLAHHTHTHTRTRTLYNRTCFLHLSLCGSIVAAWFVKRHIGYNSSLFQDYVVHTPNFQTFGIKVGFSISNVPSLGI